jgi:hypothetical protein
VPTCWMGSHFSQSSRVLSCSPCILTILLSSELSESASATLIKSLEGRRASSRLSSGMSALFGLERASAGVLVFPVMCSILKL